MVTVGGGTDASASDLRELGNSHVRARRHAEAREAYTRALDVVGHDDEALRVPLLSNRALCHLELQDAPAAIADCDAVLALQPRHAKALFRRGLAREVQGRHDEAIVDLEAAADVLDHVDADLQAALRRVRKEYQRGPAARAKALSAEARRQMRGGQHLRAIELLTEAIELTPQDATLYEARARECGALEKYNAVLHDSERIIELRPELAAGHVLAGMALYCECCYSSPAAESRARERDVGCRARASPHAPVPSLCVPVRTVRAAPACLRVPPRLLRGCMRAHAGMQEYEQATHAYTRAALLEPSDTAIAEARDDAAKKLGASLRQAAMAGNIALLQRYTRNRIADFDVRDENGFTPLTLAVVGGHAEAVELLLKAGLPVDAKDRFGKTALHWAASRGLAALGTLLLDAGAAHDARDDSGWDALTGAAHAGCYALVEVLLARSEQPAALNARQKESVPTALMAAAQNGHAHVVRLLLSSGADPRARLAPKGLTALDIATQGKHEGAAALLRPVTPIETFEQGL